MAQSIMIPGSPKREEDHSGEDQVDLVQDDHIELIDDLDVLVESSKCNCNASDDNPY